MTVAIGVIPFGIFAGFEKDLMRIRDGRFGMWLGCCGSN